MITGKKGPAPTELTFTANSIPRMILIMKIAAKEEGGPLPGRLGWMALRKSGLSRQQRMSRTEQAELQSLVCGDPAARDGQGAKQAGDRHGSILRAVMEIFVFILKTLRIH